MCKKLVRKESVMLKIVPIDTKSKKYVIKHDNVVFSDDDLIFIDIVSDTVTFFSSDTGLDSITLNITKTINHVRLMAWYDRYKQRKACKKG